MTKYYSSINQCNLENPPGNCRHLAYGTVVYLPSSPLIDFGPSTWPPVHIKKLVCPRVLMCQAWVDGRLTFVGGKSEKNESPVACLNREFHEETGSKVIFSEDERIFSRFGDGQTSHFFLKIFSIHEEFIELLINFHRQHLREAYVDEVFGLVGLPIWVEGPDNPLAASGNKDIWGLPRFLTPNGGGLMSLTLGNDFKVREQLLIILLKLKLVDENLMRKVFTLANSLTSNPVPLPTYEDFMNIPGLADVLR